VPGAFRPYRGRGRSACDVEHRNGAALRPEPRREQHRSDCDGDIGARRSAPNRAVSRTVPTATATSARGASVTARAGKTPATMRWNIGTSALPPTSATLIDGVGAPPGAVQRVLDRGQGAGEQRAHRASTHVRSCVKSRWWRAARHGKSTSRTVAGPGGTSTVFCLAAPATVASTV